VERKNCSALHLCRS